MKVLVFAHFDPNGHVREDIIDLIKTAAAIYTKIYFVSTNLGDESAKELNGFCTVIRRENIGYDFFSYRAGILEVANSPDINAPTGHVSLMNSSFVIFDREKFLHNIDQTFQQGKTVACISESFEIKHHAQSYAVTLPFDIFRNRVFKSWWDDMSPLNDRWQVIVQYEIGLSQMVLSLGYAIFPTYKPGFTLRNRKIKNPCFKNPERFLNKTGIIKTQILRDNPHQQDLSKIEMAFKKSDFTKRLYIEAKKS